MNPLGQRLLDRWDNDDEHGGVTTTMLDRALDRGWINLSEHDSRTAAAQV